MKKGAAILLLGLLAERSKMRADCEAEMLQHFLGISRTMPPEQGRQYLAWVEQHLRTALAQLPEMDQG
jgi:hypothetical protein